MERKLVLARQEPLCVVWGGSREMGALWIWELEGRGVHDQDEDDRADLV